MEQYFQRSIVNFDKRQRAPYNIYNIIKYLYIVLINTVK
jgi:hypothetical protein